MKEDDILKDFDDAISERSKKSEESNETVGPVQDQELDDDEFQNAVLRGRLEEERFLEERTIKSSAASSKANKANQFVNDEEAEEFIQWRSERERRMHKSDERYSHRQTQSVLHKKDSWNNRNLSLYYDPNIVPPNEVWLWATTKIRNEVQNENIRTLLAKDWEPLPIESFPKYKNLGSHLSKMGLQDHGTIEVGSATLMRRTTEIDNDERDNTREYIAQVQRAIERNTVNMGPRYGIGNIDTSGELQRTTNANPSFQRRPQF